MINIKRVTFSYNGQDEALKEIDLSISKGSFVAVVGHNGSGKSTLAKLMVGLITPSSGIIEFDKKDVFTHLSEVRKHIGIVFQNPDNQFVGVTVRHDIAFGLENLNIQPKEIHERIHHYAKLVGMTELLHKEPHQLSGGQKQRVAIAASLVMEQDVIIFDEATSMLDPEGVNEIMTLIQTLHRDYQKTIIMITHDVKLAKRADRIVVLRAGRVIDDGTPEAIFSRPDVLKSSQLLLPTALQLYNELSESKEASNDVLEALWAYNLNT
jgi:energy-coupling factor transport system ATP-binding protein